MSRPRCRAHDRHMDGLTMIILAISALALLDIAAINLRGEERRPASHRSIRATR